MFGIKNSWARLSRDIKICHIFTKSVMFIWKSWPRLNEFMNNLILFAPTRSDAWCSEIFTNLPTCIFYRVHPAGIWKLNRKYSWNTVPVFYFPLPVLIFKDVRDDRDSFCLCVLRVLNFSFIFCFTSQYASHRVPTLFSLVRWGFIC